MTKKGSTPSKREVFITGGILFVLGLYVLASAHDLLASFFLQGIGIVFMASTSKAFLTKLFDFFLSIFKGVWERLSHI
jgi:hypothetical protein